MSIRFGVCAKLDKIQDVIDAGYDYFESEFRELVTMSEEDFQKLFKTVNDNKFYAESYNNFFPASMRLTGEDVDFDAITTHCEKGMERAAALGGKVTVIGSGGARNVPEGFDMETARNQFVKVLGIAGDVAAKYGITIVIEPLNAGETNLINTVQEGIDICKKVNKPNVKALADFYHIYKSGETLDAVINGGDMLGHLHIARANDDRDMPYEEDIPKVEEWAKAVEESGYQGRLSLEGVFKPDFNQSIIRARKIVECFNK